MASVFVCVCEFCCNFNNKKRWDLCGIFHCNGDLFFNQLLRIVSLHNAQGNHARNLLATIMCMVTVTVAWLRGPWRSVGFHSIPSLIQGPIFPFRRMSNSYLLREVLLVYWGEKIDPGGKATGTEILCWKIQSVYVIKGLGNSLRLDAIEKWTFWKGFLSRKVYLEGLHFALYLDWHDLLVLYVVKIMLCWSVMQICFF